LVGGPGLPGNRCALPAPLASLAPRARPDCCVHRIRKGHDAIQLGGSNATLGDYCDRRIIHSCVFSKFFGEIKLFIPIVSAECYVR
jgi:hypothetical protein